MIAAARHFGARGVGIEIEPKLVADSIDTARRAGLGERARFVQQDLFDTDLRPATVVTLTEPSGSWGGQRPSMAD